MGWQKRNEMVKESPWKSYGEILMESSLDPNPSTLVCFGMFGKRMWSIRRRWLDVCL